MGKSAVLAEAAPSDLSARPCAATRQNGQPCGAYALADLPHCYAHTESVSAEDKLERAMRGGVHPKLRDLRDPVFRTFQDRLVWRQKIAGYVLRGWLSDKDGAVVLKALDGQAAEADRRSGRKLERAGLAIGRKLLLDAAPAFLALVAASSRQPRAVAANNVQAIPLKAAEGA
jgi:hypothetical protein